MSDMVQTFRFWVRLTRSAEATAAHRPPPELGLPAGRPTAGTAGAAGAGRPGRRQAPPVVTSGASTAQGRTPPPDQWGDGGFQECSGLELDTDLREYAEGASNDAVVRRLGRVKLAPIVLKRGMFTGSSDGYADTVMWRWLQGMVSGELPLPRYDGHVEVMDEQLWRVVARWSFDRGLPLKITGPALNAKTGEIAIEELHIAHEGLRMEATP